jgi:hypothetical protein
MGSHKVALFGAVTGLFIAGIITTVIIMWIGYEVQRIRF